MADRPPEPRRPSVRPPISPAVLDVATHYVRLSAQRVVSNGSVEQLDEAVDQATGLVPGRGIRRDEWIVMWWRGAYVLTRLRQGATIARAAEELQAIEEHEHPLSGRALSYAMDHAREWERNLDGSDWPQFDRHEARARALRLAAEQARGVDQYEVALAEEDWRQHPDDAEAFRRAYPDFATDGEIKRTSGVTYDDSWRKHAERDAAGRPVD